MEVMAPLLDPPWGWVNTLVPMTTDPRLAEPNWIDVVAYQTLFVIATVHAALTVPPFLLVMFEWQDKVDSGYLFFVFFPVQSGRRPGVADMKNIICCGREPLQSGLWGAQSRRCLP